MKDKYRKLLFYSVLVILLINSVYGQLENMSDLLAPLQSLDIIKTYFTIPTLIDFVLLLVLFQDFFKKALEKRKLPNRTIVVFAIIMDIGMLIALNNMNKTLIQFAWPLLLLGVLYHIIKNWGGENKTFESGLAFLIGYKLIDMLQNDWELFQDFPFLSLIKTILLFAGIVMVIMGIWSMISNAWGGVFGKKEKTESNKSETSKTPELGDGKKTEEDKKNGKASEPPKDIDVINIELGKLIAHMHSEVDLMKNLAGRVLSERYNLVKSNPLSETIPESFENYTKSVETLMNEKGHFETLEEQIKKFFDSPNREKSTDAQTKKFRELTGKFNRLFRIAILNTAIVRKHYISGHPEPNTVLKKIDWGF